jgi:hypothetical protein
MKDCVLAETPAMRLANIRGTVLLAAALAPAAVIAAAHQHQADDKMDDADSTHDT